MNDVDEVKSRLDIVDVISGYVPLKQTGKSFKGLSPFKTEKTPSFIVSPDKNIWHDFSSGKGGDVISFVMEMEALTFPEALEMLAKRAGVKLTPRSGSNQANASHKTKLYDACQSAMAYFHLSLSKNEKAKDYFIKTRGLSSATIKNYKLGYSPDSWESLTNYLTKKGFKVEDLIAAGLCVEGKQGKGAYDLFRARVMFPVFDAQARVVGFSARILGSEKTAKYINTPQTPIYNKSEAIYGLAQAKDPIRQADLAVVVEGNMDVVALSNAGFGNVVASSGTALTQLQLKQLARLTSNIAFCFDSDEAGIAATLRAIDIAATMDVKIDIISLKGAKDPDELLKKGKAEWQKAVEGAKYAPDYLIEIAKDRYGTTTAPGKKQFIKFITPMLLSLHDDIENQHYTKVVAQLLDTTEDSISKLVLSKTQTATSAYSQPNPELQPDSDSQADPSNSPSEKRKLTRQEKLEQILLELCLAFPENISSLDDLDLDQSSELHSNIFKVIKKSPKAKFATILKALPKEENYVKILALRGEQNYADLTAHDIRLEAFTQVARIQEINRQNAKHQLARQLSEAEASGDAKKTKQLLRDYQALLNED
ncbi:MAG: DNA primase [bacterium]